MITAPEETLQLTHHLEFMRDLQYGLSKKRKRIPSKYFYDKIGCDLFNAITHHDDYYLTQCEIEILTTHKKIFSDLFINERFNLIELGPGEGIKTKIIIDQLIKDKSLFTYIPIDISKKYIDDLARDFLHTFPGLQFHGIEADWIDGLKKHNMAAPKKNMVLFLGSSIGNFTPKASIRLLKDIAMALQNDGYLFIGFDLCKDTDILLRAYNDSSGITRNFNLNLLDRINKDLGGDIDIAQFEHQPRYNFSTNAMESFLVSKIPQSIHISRMRKTFELKLREEIHVESSYKFKLQQIEKFARLSGFDVVQNLYDSKNYFLCSLWKTNGKINIIR